MTDRDYSRPDPCGNPTYYQRESLESDVLGFPILAPHKETATEMTRNNSKEEFLNELNYTAIKLTNARMAAAIVFINTNTIASDSFQRVEMMKLYLSVADSTFDYGFQIGKDELGL
jgi:hypothetical protein